VKGSHKGGYKVLVEGRHEGVTEAVALASQVRVGCARLEEALALLKDAGAPPLAPTLESEIGAALNELRPACVLEQLKASSHFADC
jgi:hypothetical protein